MATPHRLSEPARIRILYILDDFPDPNAGTESQFWLLLRNLDRKRFAPAILLLRPSEFLAANVTDTPVEVLNVARLRSLSALWRVVRAVVRARRAGTDVVHLFFNDVSLIFPLPLRLFGIPVIVSRRDLGFWYTAWNLRVLRLNARFASAVVANCEAVRRAVIDAEHFSSQQVRVIHNGLSRDAEPAAADVRRELALPTDARLLVSVANLRPLKRMDDAIRALALLGRTVANVHLLVVGEDRTGEAAGSHRAELENLASQLGIRKRVHFLGKLQNPMPVIAAADVALLCSQTEGLSNVLIEYMFAGIPTVCTDAGGNRELIQDGETGYVVPVGAVSEIAERLAQLLADSAQARRFGEAASRRARALFSPRTMLLQHEQLYTDLIAAKRGAGRHVAHIQTRGS